MSALEVLQHDLSEFTCTVQNDTQDAMVQSTNALKDTLSVSYCISSNGFVKFYKSISYNSYSIMIIDAFFAFYIQQLIISKDLIIEILE